MFTKCVPQTLEALNTLSRMGGSCVQEYFNNNTTTLFAFFIVWAFVLMVQKQL